MLKFIIDEGLFDKASLDLRADGFESLSASLESYTPESIASHLDVDPEMIKKAATFFAKAEKGVIILAEGLNKSRDSVALTKAATNLALITGNIGKESCGVYVFGEKANAQGLLTWGFCPMRFLVISPSVMEPPGQSSKISGTLNFR